MVAGLLAFKINKNRKINKTRNIKSAGLNKMSNVINVWMTYFNYLTLLSVISIKKNVYS